MLKTFEDLEFKPHPVPGNTRAYMAFENDYGISVLFGKDFYLNGIDTYEVAVWYKDEITYDTDITDDVIPRITKDEVFEIMKQIQQLNSKGN